MDAVLFKATTLSDAWFQLVNAVISGKMPDGSPTPLDVYEIDKGSYVGQKRLEFNHVTVQIDHPGAMPLIPDIPEGLGIPAPVESMQYVEDYFAKYLMDPELEENETYKYATWLAPGVERVIEQLKGAPGNNQAVISVGGWCEGPDGIPVADGCGEAWHSPPGSMEVVPAFDTDNFIDPATGQRDSACLRLVDFRLDQNNTLHMVAYFRSWDLWGGFPANLAGLQMLKTYVAQQIGATDGKIIASSKGLHIYSHAIQVAATRLGMTEVGDTDKFLSWIRNGRRGDDSQEVLGHFTVLGAEVNGKLTFLSGTWSNDVDISASGMFLRVEDELVEIRDVDPHCGSVDVCVLTFDSKEIELATHAMNMVDEYVKFGTIPRLEVVIRPGK